MPDELTTELEDAPVESLGWPALPYAEWVGTKKTLHMCAQMIGKARLAMAPAQPEWLHTCLFLDAHGFTTGPMPYGDYTITMGIDVFAATLWVCTSDGRFEALELASPTLSVANVWNDFDMLLSEMGLSLDIWQRPQEVTDTRPFSAHTSDGEFVAEHAQRFHAVLSTLNGVFEEFRSPFFGRTGIQFWWGACDFSVLLFTGKKLDAPEDRGYIRRYDLDAEHLVAGFWPGDDDAPEPLFYGYLVPEPPGCVDAAIAPEHASWVESMGEWMMSYEAVRTCDDPRQAVLDFLHSIYAVAVERGGWDASAHTYEKPRPPVRQ